MEPALILTVAIFVFLLVTVAKGVRQVPQGNKWVVQRLGKYYTSLNPGLNFVIPYIDSIAYKVTTKDIVLDIPSQEVITKDNAVIMTNAVAYNQYCVTREGRLRRRRLHHCHTNFGADITALYCRRNDPRRRPFIA